MPLDVYTCVHGRRLSPSSYSSPCSEELTGAPTTGNRTCPPWVWPETIKPTESCARRQRSASSGECDGTLSSGRRYFLYFQLGGVPMHGIIYIVGLVVVVLFILSLLGLR